mgnify:CR=1 FL=1
MRQLPLFDEPSDTDEPDEPGIRCDHCTVDTVAMISMYSRSGQETGYRPAATKSCGECFYAEDKVEFRDGRWWIRFRVPDSYFNEEDET